MMDHRVSRQCAFSDLVVGRLHHPVARLVGTITETRIRSIHQGLTALIQKNACTHLIH